jgi:uncharacterized protein (TIGR02266 family)
MPIVSLSVRFKASSPDEFIERHAQDVGAHGIYLKTERPSPLDTLVQLQIELTTGQSVIAGLGRVVWTRDTFHATADRPAGMGVKFVKIDERSRAFLGYLVTTRPEAGRAFEEEAEQTSASADEPPLAAQRIAARKTTPRPSVSPTADSSLLGRLPFLRKPGSASSNPPPRSTPPQSTSSRPPAAPTSPSRAPSRPPVEPGGRSS